jgi:hypothetical protein
MDSRFVLEDGYYRVKYTGIRTLSGILALLKDVETNAVDTGVYNYLFDLRESEEGFSTMDKYNLGIYIANHFGRNFKLSVLIRKEHITGFLENVALNRGAANFMITDDRNKAEIWMGAVLK